MLTGKREIDIIFSARIMIETMINLEITPGPVIPGGTESTPPDILFTASFSDPFNCRLFISN
jgi:hypothetical protein